MEEKAEQAAAEKVAAEQAAAEKVAAEKAAEQPTQVAALAQVAQPVAEQPAPQQSADNKAAPVFKVQIVVTSAKQGSKSPHLKGETDVDYYVEGGLYKYTKGASTNYNEILRLRRQLAEKFPQCFVIAFKNGEKMDAREAIREFQKKK